MLRDLAWNVLSSIIRNYITINTKWCMCPQTLQGIYKHSTFVKSTLLSISQYFSVPHTRSKSYWYSSVFNKTAVMTPHCFSRMITPPVSQLRKLQNWCTKTISPRSTYTIKCALNEGELESSIHLYCIFLVQILVESYQGAAIANKPQDRH